MANVVWPQEDVRDVRAATALRELQEQTTQAARDEKERQGMLTQQPAQPPKSDNNSWNFSTLRGTLMPWDTSQPQSQTPAAPQPSVEPDPWDFTTSLRSTLMPWAPQQQPAPTPSGTPSAMPTAPGLTPATITTGPRPGQTLQPGESVGSVTLQQGPKPQANGDYRAYARSVAQQYGLDPDIFERQINQESGFQPWGPDGKPLGSSAGAQGIAQFMPGTAAGYGVDVNDPYSSLDGAARHMRDLLKANNGNYRLALAAYNAGQGNVDKYGEGVFDDDFAAGQTRDYVNIILGPGAARAGRQSSMNAGAGLPPAASAAPAGPGSAPPAAGAGALHPTVAQKWRQQFGRDPSPEEAAELAGLLGVSA